MKQKLQVQQLTAITIIMLSFSFTSCGSWYYCTVSGFGSTPQETTYYIEPIDSNLIDDLEFQEYAGMLRGRLNESGYRETNSDDAALCVRLGYYIGEKEFVGTTTSSGGFSMTNGKITANTNAIANGTATTNLYGNTSTTKAQANGSSSTNVKTNQQTNTYSYSNTSAIYNQNIGCYIEVLSTRNMKPVWTVEVLDHMTYAGFRKVMPWMIASAQAYFGKSGEGEVKITKKEGEEQKGLVWPY